MAWHPSAKHIATASDDNTIKLWVSSSGELLKTLAGHTHYVFCCAFSPKGNLLASGSFDETIRIWDFSNGQCLKVSAATPASCSSPHQTGHCAPQQVRWRASVQPGSQATGCRAASCLLRADIRSTMCLAPASQAPPSLAFTAS